MLQKDSDRLGYKDGVGPITPEQAFNSLPESLKQKNKIVDVDGRSYVVRETQDADDVRNGATDIITPKGYLRHIQQKMEKIIETDKKINSPMSKASNVAYDVLNSIGGIFHPESAKRNIRKNLHMSKEEKKMLKDYNERDSKNMGGLLQDERLRFDPIIKKTGKKEKRKKYQEGKEVKSVPTRQELLDLEKISTEKLDKLRMKLIDEAMEREDAVDAHYLRNANYGELEEKFKRIEEAKKEAEQRRKEKEMEYNMDEAAKKHKNRILSAEGGEMDSQMTMMMMPTEETEETEEMDMLPDDQMEDQHLDFIINESLDNEEEMYLMEQLQADERLSMIFDKIMDTATEFSGSGPVEGLGTEVSDSIPARLSDGEFVMTAKATDEIGADSLERMMKDAEEASDNRQRVAMGGEIEKKVDRFGKPIDEDLTAEEIKRSMLSVNPRLQ